MTTGKVVGLEGSAVLCLNLLMNIGVNDIYDYDKGGTQFILWVSGRLRESIKE